MGTPERAAEAAERDCSLSPEVIAEAERVAEAMGPCKPEHLQALARIVGSVPAQRVRRPADQDESSAAS